MTDITTWPSKTEELAQPWESDEPAITPRPGLPLLTAGSADPQAAELFAKLGELGYETPISKGERAHGVVGPEEMAAVRQFRNDYNVREDPAPFGGENAEGRATADNHIGPWTIEALLRAHENEPEGAEATQTGW